MSATPRSNPVVVLNVGGVGRSGSTILSALLGNCEGFFPVGEFRGIWRANETDELCGCGQPFSSCEFWRRVGEQAFGGWDRVNSAACAQADAYLVRHRRLPGALIAFRRSSQSDAHREYCATLARLFAAVKKVSGCSVIVDSTKDPPYSLLLRGVPGLDVRFVHLVRDSRGVVYSWNKKDVELPEFASGATPAFMTSPSAWRSTAQWILKNLAFSCATPAAARRLVKYESLVSEPREQLACILRLAGKELSAAVGSTVPCDEFLSLPFHTIGGNPVRFERGAITLSLDEEWRSKMRPAQKLMVSTLTFPLLVAYGYVSHKRGQRESSSSLVQQGSAGREAGARKR